MFVRAGIDNGTRLAAPGIVWSVSGETWEVLFTGSVGWKRGVEKNSRSHKLPLAGPHFVFVRQCEFLGKPISWGQINKFPAPRFFAKGKPARVVDKTNLAIAVKNMNVFLEDVRNPKIGQT